MNRSTITRRLVPAFVVAAVVLAACGSDSAEPAETDATPSSEASAAADATAATRADTIEDGVLTIATGNPAFFPWVIDDAPETGEGFEAAVALRRRPPQMGYEGDAVKWVRTDFDAAIQPGAKDFDFNLQQFSITDERQGDHRLLAAVLHQQPGDRRARRLRRRGRDDRSPT